MLIHCVLECLYIALSKQNVRRCFHESFPQKDFRFELSSENETLKYNADAWAPAGFFPGVGKLGVWDKSPPAVPGMEPRWDLGGKAPWSRRQFAKIMHK